MSVTYGTREIVRNPSLLRIAPDASYVIEDKKSHKPLGVYIGSDLAKEFFDYIEKKKMLESAQKIKSSAKQEAQKLEESLSDGV